jgi:hypothetical protein
VQVGNFNKKGYDRTLWYTIDYEVVDKLDESIRTKCPDACGQDDRMDVDKMDTPIPETTTDYTQTISEEEPTGSVPGDDFSDIPWSDGSKGITTKGTPQTTDPIEHAAIIQQQGGGGPSWTVAGPNGADPYLDRPLDAALLILRRKRDGMDPKVQAKLARQLRRIVRGPAKEEETEPPKNGTPALFLEACRLWPDVFHWKDKKNGKRRPGAPYTNTYNGAFVNDLRSLMRQIEEGTIGSGKKIVIGGGIRGLG